MLRLAGWPGRPGVDRFRHTTLGSPHTHRTPPQKDHDDDDDDDDDAIHAVATPLLVRPNPPRQPNPEIDKPNSPAASTTLPPLYGPQAATTPPHGASRSRRSVPQIAIGSSNLAQISNIEMSIAKCITISYM